MHLGNSWTVPYLHLLGECSGIAAQIGESRLHLLLELLLHARDVLLELVVHSLKGGLNVELKGLQTAVKLPFLKF